jgi:CMP-N,N'-diacetyllegionaminic acid synthase
MTSSIIALIPARGGSKGIPRKNLLPIGGKPLLAYSILQARASAHIARVIVSTDDEEIAGVARAWGAEVPFMRPAELARDESPDIDVFRHALLWLRENEDYQPQLAVHLRPPGPVRRVELIDKAIELLLAHPEADAVRAVSPAQESPFKMWRLTENGGMEPALRLPGVADAQSLPRQRLPQVYWQNGYVDVLRPRAVLEKNSMWGTCVLPFIINEPIFELDYPEDIVRLEQALKRLDAHGAPSPSASAVRHAV